MKKSTVILIWGGITAIVSTAFSQILYATGQDESPLKWINTALVFLGLLIGTFQVRSKSNGGYITYGEGFMAGFLMTCINTVVAVIATIVGLQIHPDMIDKIRERGLTDMINKGYDEKQIEMGKHMMETFTTPVAIVIEVIIITLFFGSLFSLITAAICNKKKPIFDDSDTTASNTPQV